MVEFQRPGQATVEYFYNGIIALLPTYAISAFRLPKNEYVVQRNYRGISDPEDFKTLLLKSIYDEHGRHPSSLQEAVATVARWHEGGGVNSSVPENIDELVKELDEQDAGYKKALASKKLLLEAQKAAEEAEKTSQAAIQPETPSEVKPQEIKTSVNVPVEEEAPAQSGTGPTAESSAVGIKINYSKTGAGARFRAQSRTATTRWVVAHSYEKIRQADPEKAAAISMWAHGITSSHLDNKIKDLPDKYTLELEKIIKAIQGLETDPIQTAIMRQSFPIKYIDFILDPESSVTQSEMMIVYNPPDGGGVYVPQGCSFVGNMVWSVAQQFATKAITKQVTGLLAKAGTQAVVTAGAEAATAAAGAAAGAGGAAAGAAAGTAIPIPILGTLIGLVVGFVVGVLFSVAEKLTMWLKKNARDILFGSVAILAYGGFVGSPALIASGLGLGALSALNGGLRGTGKQAGGLGSTVIGGMTTTIIPSVGIPFLGALIATPIIIAIILVIINSGAYVVPPTPFTSSGFGGNITCSPEKGPVSFGNNGASPISSRAWEIVADLYQGFWCFWNRPPSSPPRADFPNDVVLYPPTYNNLFNYELFKRNPNPTREEMQSCGDCLFWCTYLVVKSYRESGNNDFQLTLWAPTMQEDWERREKFVPGTNATPSSIKPGSVIFFNIVSGPPRTNHVGIVHSVNRDAVVYVQSNAPTKDGMIPFNLSGVGVQNPPGIGIVGFGLP